MKNGIDYFSFDVQLDDKFELIEAEFGLTGFAVVVKLFQKIYGGQGYYCEWTNDVSLLFSKKIGRELGGNVVSEIVNASIKRGIFDRNLYDKYSILTSAGIQKRYFEAVSRRKKINVKREYLLVQLDQNLKDVYIFEENVDISDKNVDISKQSKVKESKVKESKVNMGSENSSDPSSPKHKYGEYKNVLLSDEDMEKLKTEFPNDYLNRIERLSAYVASTGRKYKNHLATIRNWARNDKSVTNIQSSNDNNYSDLEMLARRRYD